MITFQTVIGAGKRERTYRLRRQPDGKWAVWHDPIQPADPYFVNPRAKTCNCPAGRRGKACKHLTRVLELESQMVAVAGQPEAAPKPPAPLWPQPIPILGLTGEYQSGKTWFGISISPDPRRLRVYDFELSAAPYRALGFDYVNVAEVMAQKYPRGAKPVDVWNWWLDDVSGLDVGRYDVILADPVTDLERGLTDWVTANPTFFGHTAGQYQSMSGIMWGDLKDYWKLILSSRVATKCQTFAFVAHLGDEFKGKQHTGRRAPKGKDTLLELATLYLWLARDKNPDGSRPSAPAAEVLKSRLSHLGMGPDGPEIREALPPRLPVATPKAVRQYLLNPPDYANLKPEERAPERGMTADERLRLEVAKAEAERDAALARGGVPAAVAAPAPRPTPASTAPAVEPEPLTDRDRAGLREIATNLAAELKIAPATFAAVLEKDYGRRAVEDLADAQLVAVVDRLRARKGG